MPDSPHFILVDGSSYLFRAFHALPPLVTSRGQPTGATRGVISMVRKLINDYPDSNIVMVFDAKGRTFRNDIYGEYKAHRPPMPDDLRVQIPPIHNIIRAMGLPLLIIEGVEADDVIGTLSVQASTSKLNTLISTGDKDLAQLVNDRVSIINTMNENGEKLDREGVEKKFGVGPELIVDYLALMGDKVDNIPGVEGVGPKTAVKWLQQFGSMQGVIDNAESIGGKIGERLRNSLDQLRLSRVLATIKLDCELGMRLEDLVRGEADTARLHTLFSELEFKSFLRELEQPGGGGSTDPGASFRAGLSQPSIPDQAVPPTETVCLDREHTDYQCIVDRDALEDLVCELEAGEKFGLSLEFHGPHFLSTQILGVAVSPEIGRASYVPIGHGSDQPQLPMSEVLEVLKPVLQNAAVVKAGYDLKTQSHVLHNFGIDLQPLKSDVLLASYVLNSVANKHQLADIVRCYLGVDLRSLDDLLGKGRKKLRLNQIGISDFGDYSCERADLSLRLAIQLEHALSKEGQLDDLYRYYETPLIEVLQTMERNGIRLDVRVLEQQSQQLADELGSLQKTIHRQAGEEFNLSSPRQLQAILFDKLNLPVLKKTPTGQPSTAEPVLVELAQDHAMPRLILEHRSLSKLKSTYTDKLPEEVNRSSGRIHSSFQQAVAATGRLSSAEPNLQNIPIRTAQGRRVRQAFIAESGYKLLAADYSQVELRIMAHLSGDPGLLSAFNSDEDVHRATAADVFNCALEEVTAEQRRGAKAINFGLIYGMSAFGLSKQLKVSRHQSQDYIERYFGKYPGVRKFMEKTRAYASEQGYVETLFGRRLYLPNIRAGNAMLRKAAERTAINAPMQGTAADIIKRAMIDIANWLEQVEIQARMILQVHDELVFEVKEADVDLLSEGVRFRMASAAELDVPLVVDVGVGDNWDEAH